MSNLKRKLNALTLSDKLKIINEIEKSVQKKNLDCRRFWDSSKYPFNNYKKQR